MLQSMKQINGSKKTTPSRYRKLALIGKRSKGILNDLANPIDSTNRFINLALHSIGDNSQGRQFLLESKDGIRKMAALLQRLNDHVKKMEQEIKEISEYNE